MNNFATQDLTLDTLDGFLNDAEGADIQPLSNQELNKVDGGMLPVLLIVGGALLAGVAAGAIYEHYRKK
jgi:lactobin A/cerein 7B family class IIb bacteriocin